MKKAIPVLVLTWLILSPAFHAQTYFEDVTMNNVRFRLHANGLMFYDSLNQTGVCEMPLGNGQHALRAGGFWFAGVNESGQLQGSAHTSYTDAQWRYGLNITDPSAPGTGMNQIWGLTRTEVNAFRDEFTANGYIANLSLYPNIRDYPAFVLDRDGNRVAFAPFVDVDGDPFVYDPTAGDYPVMYGDKMRFLAFTGASHTHGPTGQFAPVDVMMWVFSYYCPSSTALRNSLFIKYRLVNPSVLSFNNAHAGYYLGYQIGNPQDNFFGSDPSLELMYGYNGYPIDSGGYGSFSPAVGATLLQGFQDGNGLLLNAANAAGFRQDTAGNEGFPYQMDHVYNYLRNPKRDLSGTPGFAYDGNPTLPAGNTESAAGNSPGTRAGVLAMETFDFLPGQVTEGYFAISMGVDSLVGGVFGMGVLKDHITQIRNAWHPDSTGPCGAIHPLEIEPLHSLSGQIWPNPAQDEVIIRSDQFPVDEIQILNLEGKLVRRWDLGRENEVKVPLNHLPAGMYLVSVRTRAGQFWKKLIKM